jgi:hypothetical protein
VALFVLDLTAHRGQMMIPAATAIDNRQKKRKRKADDNILRVSISHLTSGLSLLELHNKAQHIKMEHGIEMELSAPRLPLRLLDE